ncbi:MAG: 30S ribosomal protein S17 [Candidatus Asgardarchaeia archaeon]
MRNIGIPVKNVPEKECNDKLCPYHGSLPVRGRVFEGIVISDKMKNTIIIKREHKFYVKKYKRYETRTYKLAAHKPPCIDVKVGDVVRVAECRPLSKTVSFVVIEKVSGG